MFLPSDDGVIFQREEHQHDRREPEETGGDSESNPQRDVPDVQRIAKVRERAALHERAQPIASRPRNDADVAHPPHPQRFARESERDAAENRRDVSRRLT